MARTAFADSLRPAGGTLDAGTGIGVPELVDWPEDAPGTALAGLVVPALAGLVVAALAGLVVPGLAGLVVPALAGLVVPGLAGLVVAALAGLVVAALAGLVGAALAGLVGAALAAAGSPHTAAQAITTGRRIRPRVNRLRGRRARSARAPARRRLESPTGRAPCAVAARRTPRARRASRTRAASRGFRRRRAPGAPSPGTHSRARPRAEPRPMWDTSVRPTRGRGRRGRRVSRGGPRAPWPRSSRARLPRSSWPREHPAPAPPARSAARRARGWR